MLASPCKIHSTSGGQAITLVGMTNFAHGHEAEKVAAEYLKKQGYKVIELNWRRPQAEIDIVARKKKGPILFTEVKYRQAGSQGAGLDYVTPRKLTQMQFAAQLWAQENRYGGDYELAAIEVSGPGYAITAFLDNLT